MIKNLLKLIVVAAIANATWRFGSAYLSFYRFRDAVTDMAIHSKGKTDEEVKQKVVELAASYDEPIDADAISVRREEREGQHTFIEGSYTKPVWLAPGYEYACPFNLNVDGFVIVPVKLGDLTKPPE